MNSYGTMRLLEDGQLQQQPDYVKALELYRRLLREFPKGRDSLLRSGAEQIKNITEPSLSVGVVEHLSARFRNPVWVECPQRPSRRLCALQVRHDARRPLHRGTEEDEDEGEGESAPWVQRIPTAGRAPVKAWSKNFNDSHTHKSFSEQIRIEGKLPVGAYLLEAKSGSLSARDMMLVSDATLVLKSAGKQALVFFADAVTGAPIANANIALWESYYLNNRWRWRRLRQTTDADGLARFALRTVPTPATSLLRRQATIARRLPPAIPTALVSDRRLAHLRLHRSSCLSSEGNDAMEVHRQAIEERSLFNSRECRLLSIRSTIRAARKSLKARRR